MSGVTFPIKLLMLNKQFEKLETILMKPGNNSYRLHANTFYAIEHI